MTAVVLFATVVYVLDRVSKVLLVRKRPVGVRLIASSRAGLGLARSPGLLMVVWAIALAAAMTLVHSGQAAGTVAQAALGSALGGAAGNLVDHARRRAVLDFIDLGFGSIFNVADIAIVLGVPVALVSVL